MPKLYRLLFILLLLLQWACQSEAVSPVSSFILTQEQLDAAILVNQNSDIGVTGTPFGNRQNDSTRFLIRDIYSNIPADQSLGVGSIVAIRAFENVKSNRGRLKLIDIMVKHESGYNKNGGDFEYIRISYDPATDYATHPNGLLPDISQIKSRGLDLVISPESCASCHRKAGKDNFIFSRNFR